MDAIVILTNDVLDISSSSLHFNSSITEKIREKTGLIAPSGIQRGEFVPIRVEELECQLIYMANLGPSSTDKAAFKEVSALNYVKTPTVEPRGLEHRWLVYHGLFELVFESLRNSSDSSRKQIFKEIFLFYREIVCCVYSLELPHRGDSNEYTQHTITV